MKEDDLFAQVQAYLAAHHTMTLATCGDDEGPHAASLFYALTGRLRLVFVSKASSIHGRHIGKRARVAATVTEQYADWREIQGVQLWGEARLLTGTARIRGLAAFMARFSFVEDLLKQAGRVGLSGKIDVYVFTPERVAFTDNTVGLFGREVLDLEER
jgi:uncharacterized protein YhbP (UPF0306 family)